MTDCDCLCPVTGTHYLDCAIYGAPPEPPVVTLACGHSGFILGTPQVGAWVSCWAVVFAVSGKMADSCQTQRKIVAVEGSRP